LVQEYIRRITMPKDITLLEEISDQELGQVNGGGSHGGGYYSSVGGGSYRGGHRS